MTWQAEGKFLARYAVATMAAYGSNLATAGTLVAAGAPFPLAMVAAYAVSSSLVFLLHKHFTFRGRGGRGEVQYGKTLALGGLNYAIVLPLVSVFKLVFGFPFMWAYLASKAFLTIFNLLAYRLNIFSGKNNQPEAKRGLARVFQFLRAS